MERIDDNDRWRLSSGRELSPHRNIIGLDVIDGGLYGGYDDTMFEAHADYEPGDGYDPPWTPAERAELADFMIAKWQAFKAPAEHVHDWWERYDSRSPRIPRFFCRDCGATSTEEPSDT